ncbi:hypothetical protein RRG08_031886 [Elysia crispata]|uniref:Uncharacterized protein n=1 Tax=Elysia crispata TaxID=231223 RepID=A0AAE1AGZ5_9GAST|nr:hypothetical protein RRG08_031886 [Elysia crispata]
MMVVRSAPQQIRLIELEQAYLCFEKPWRYDTRLGMDLSGQRQLSMETGVGSCVTGETGIPRVARHTGLLLSPLGLESGDTRPRPTCLLIGFRLSPRLEDTAKNRSTSLEVWIDSRCILRVDVKTNLGSADERQSLLVLHPLTPAGPGLSCAPHIVQPVAPQQSVRTSPVLLPPIEGEKTKRCATSPRRMGVALSSTSFFAGERNMDGYKEWSQVTKGYTFCSLECAHYSTIMLCSLLRSEVTHQAIVMLIIERPSCGLCSDHSGVTRGQSAGLIQISLV